MSSSLFQKRIVRAVALCAALSVPHLRAAESIESILDAVSQPPPTVPAQTAEDLLPVVPDVAPAPIEVAPAVEAVAPVAPEAPAVEQPVAPAPADASDAKKMEVENVIRLQAKEKEAKIKAEAGIGLEQAGEYDKAIAELKAALGELPDRPSNRDLTKKARETLATAYFRSADQKLRSGGNLNEAKIAAMESEKLGNKKAARLIRDIDAAILKREEIAARPVPVQERKEFVDRAQSVADLIAEGRAQFDAKDYAAAERAFERVLLKDEYNVDAMRYLRRIQERELEIHTTEREATRAAAVDQVRASWTPPIREEVNVPEGAVGATSVRGPSGVEKLRKKMENIMFPLIDFREANIIDVVKFLNEESVNLDKTEGVGVNVILNLNIPQSGGAAAGSPAAAPDLGLAGGLDLGGGVGGGVEGLAPLAPIETATEVAGAGGAGMPTITLSLRRVSLLNAIKYITEVASLKFRIDEDAVIITPEGVVQGRVVTRLYPVQPTFMDTVVERGDTEQREGGEEFVSMGSSATNIRRAESDQVKRFFENAGVPFPAGTSISYNTAISQLIVANTPENLELFERIIAQLDVVPKQVEIEARFVEIGQDDLEELGFQWGLTDNYEFLMDNRNPALPVSARQRVQMNADSEGFSKGLRFFSLNDTGGFTPSSAGEQGLTFDPLGNIATFASVLTNPEMRFVINALEQKGGTDLLSAPRVTTRSGVNAQIQVVKEIIYPTEFDADQIETTIANPNGDGIVNTRAAIIVPGSFETRQTGVILNVTPTVGPDGYTIDLTLVPEVTELVDWIQYGNEQLNQNIPQPVFATRQVTTSIVLWDGQTVMMGGLIREQVTTMKDKIPVLGDIPVLGRLFRSEGSFSEKKNLLIFVTARLVDPAGKTIRRGGMDSGVEAPAAAPAPAT